MQNVVDVQETLSSPVLSVTASGSDQEEPSQRTAWVFPTAVQNVVLGQETDSRLWNPLICKGSDQLVPSYCSTLPNWSTAMQSVGLGHATPRGVPVSGSTSSGAPQALPAGVDGAVRASADPARLANAKPSKERTEIDRARIPWCLIGP